jgi:hypothetical protein
LPLTELARTWQGLDSQSVFAFGTTGPADQVEIEEIEEGEFTGYSYHASDLRSEPLVESSTDTTDVMAGGEADSLGRVDVPEKPGEVEHPDTMWAGSYDGD